MRAGSIPCALKVLLASVARRGPMALDHALAKVSNPDSGLKTGLHDRNCRTDQKKDQPEGWPRCCPLYSFPSSS